MNLCPIKRSNRSCLKAIYSMKSIVLLTTFIIFGIMFSGDIIAATSWWDTDYKYRYFIDSNSTSTNTISVNDTYGIGFDKRIVWANNASAGETIYLYCKVSGCATGDIAIGNDTSEIPWENETTGTGNAVADVWKDNYIVYHFNYTGDTTEYDSTTHGFHGTISNTHAEVIDGVFGYGLNLTKTESQVAIPSEATLTLQNGSMEIWFKPSATIDNGLADAGGGKRLYRSNVVNQWDGYFINGNGAFRLTSICGPDSGTVINLDTTTTTWTAGTWHHILYSWNGTTNGGNMSVYVNGVAEASCGPKNPDYPMNFSNFKIGYRGVSWGGFNGTIDEFRVWNKSLSASEVQEIYYNGINNLTNITINRLPPNPVIHLPENNSIIIGTTIEFNYSVNDASPDTCMYEIDNAANVTIPGCINITITLDYGEHNITLYINDATGNLNATTNLFTNSFAVWNISLFNENDWDVPFDMELPDSVTLFLFCFGLDTFTFNLSNSTTIVTPTCRVKSILIRVEYPTDSYTRERLAPTGINTSFSMYLVDAFNETLLQIPFIMGDSPFFNSNLTLYKIADGVERIISQGSFDVEFKHVSYLIKDNKYNMRITGGGRIREIGFFQAVSAGTQTININQIQLGPDIMLINNNIIMAAETFSATQTLVIEYTDLLAQTTSVQILAFNGTTITPFYNMTFNDQDIITVTLAVNTSNRFTVKWIVTHEQLGNSPIYFVIGAGAFGGLFNLGVLSWIYQLIGFIFILFTSFVVTPKNRLVGIAFITVILSFMAFAAWLTLGIGVALILLVFVGLAVVYEVRRLGLT